jgi:serine/threonine-protein kinase
MDVAVLRERLASVGVERVDVPAAVRRHLAAGGRDEPDAVLHSLLMEGAIDRSHFAALSSDATVIVTGGSPTLSSDAPTAVMAQDVTSRGEATVVQGSDSAAPPAGPRAASLERRYVVLGMAGKGGMGTVHVARDVDLLRKVALKQLVPEAARDASARARFNREVQVTAQLDHPNIVPVYSLEVAADGGPAYSMKLVEGRTFAALIDETLAFAREGRAPDEAHALPVRLEHFLKVCDAMSYAHDRGVIHRDLKPANLMLGPHNEVYVMDWGICRVVGEPVTADETAPSPVHSPESTETQVGTIVGTPMFMSPEQARADRDLDARSDQCALGLILYKLVTLKSPYDGRTGLEILTHVVKGERRPVEPEKGAEPVPRELVAIVDKATHPQVDRRYRNVRAFADDVRRFLRGEAVEARPDSSWERTVRRLARHRQTVAVSVLALVTAAALAIVGLVVRHERALEREAFRNARLQTLAGDVGRAGDVLQTRMLEVVGELDALSVVAAHALSSGDDGGGPVPGLDANAPAGQGGAFTAAPGSDPAVVRRQARRLQRSAAQEQELLERAVRLLGGEKATTSSGLVDLRIGLASGLVYQFPRPAAAPAAADPREAAWYREGADKDAPHWGEPYLDGGGVRLPFGAPIRGAKGELLGVISLVLVPQGVLEQVLTEGPVPGTRMALLLDPGARVIAVHPKTGARERPLEPFGDPTLDAALKEHDVGTVRTTTFGSAEVLAFDRIHPFEWTLVAVVGEDVLFAPESPAAR